MCCCQFVGPLEGLEAPFRGFGVVRQSRYGSDRVDDMAVSANWGSVS